jgi:hypothetical protein
VKIRFTVVNGSARTLTIEDGAGVVEAKRL